VTDFLGLVRRWEGEQTASLQGEFKNEVQTCEHGSSNLFSLCCAKAFGHLAIFCLSAFRHNATDSRFWVETYCAYALQASSTCLSVRIRAVSALPGPIGFLAVAVGFVYTAYARTRELTSLLLLSLRCMVGRVLLWLVTNMFFGCIETALNFMIF